MFTKGSSLYNYFIWSHAILCYRQYGSNCIVKHLVVRRQPYFSSRFYFNNSATIDPIKNLKAFEDFFEVMLHAHVVAAENYLLQQKSYVKIEDLVKEIVTKILILILQCFTRTRNLCTQLQCCHLNSCGGCSKIRSRKVIVIGYCCAGNFLCFFQGKRSQKVLQGAIILLIHYHCVLSDRQAAQLKWGRFVNTSGRTGCNISCDLHLEHLNRRLKDMIRNLHSNVMDSAINRAAKSIGVVNQICSLFDQQNDVQPESDHHTQPGSQKDFNLVLKVLEDQRVFSKDGSRRHKSFKKIKPTLQQPSESMTSWLKDRIKNYKW